MSTDTLNRAADKASPRRFTGEAQTGFSSLAALILADPNISEDYKLNFAYTPEEIAIEAEERGQAEKALADLERAERAVELDHERGIWRDGSGQ